MTTMPHRDSSNEDATRAREDLLRAARELGARTEERLRPYVKRAPLTAVARAAAVGFVLGLVVPARLQMVVVAPMLRAGMRRLVRSRGGRLTPSPHPKAASSSKSSKENNA